MKFRAFNTRTKKMEYSSEMYLPYYFFEEEGIRKIGPNGEAEIYIIDFQIPGIQIGYKDVYYNDVVGHGGKYYLIKPGFQMVGRLYEIFGIGLPAVYYFDHITDTGGEYMLTQARIAGNIHENPELIEKL